MQPQISSEEVFLWLEGFDDAVHFPHFPYLDQPDLILDPTTFDDQDFPHVAVDDRPAIYSFVYSLKESFVGKNLLCKVVNVRIR